MSSAEPGAWQVLGNVCKVTDNRGYDQSYKDRTGTTQLYVGAGVGEKKEESIRVVIQLFMSQKMSQELF